MKNEELKLNKSFRRVIKCFDYEIHFTARFFSLEPECAIYTLREKNLLM